MIFTHIFLSTHNTGREVFSTVLLQDELSCKSKKIPENLKFSDILLGNESSAGLNKWYYWNDLKRATLSANQTTDLKLAFFH